MAPAVTPDRTPFGVRLFGARYQTGHSQCAMRPAVCGVPYSRSGSGLLHSVAMRNPSTFASFEKELNRLVEIFERNLAHLKSPGYDEASLRQEFLNPFFRALGWVMENKAGLIPAHREVIAESRTDTGRADYLFRTDRKLRFVCEAKRPVEELPPHAHQAKGYAWTIGVPLAVLSDFEELNIYVIGSEPKKSEPLAGLWKTFGFREYVARARELWDLLARDNVATGSIDRAIESLPKRPLRLGNGQFVIRPDPTQSFDAKFLNFLDSARRSLASDLMRHNDRADLLEGLKLNDAVQCILDRLLFIRISEERGIDMGTKLESLLETWRRQPHRPSQVNEPPAHWGGAGLIAPKGSLWNIIVRHIRALDRRPPSHVPYFNGNLFKHHFSEELVVGDDWLGEFLESICNEYSSYKFGYVAVEILGTIYERFLGKIVRPQGRGSVIEEKPEVRKAGGVYYTPRYIVEYIVEQTVGKLLEGKTPEETLKLRFLDPACGSGSFLLRVFERVCEHWQQWLIDHPNKRKKDWCWVDAKTNTLQLTSRTKRWILRETIYGVDLDPQAVEVTQLSLYLKMLEGETSETLQREQDLFGGTEPILPPLQDNIKCGNSLIASDFSMMAEDLVRVRAFDWPVQFAPIMKAGGFDAVVGNPPWLMAGYYLAPEIDYLQNAYRAATGKFDLYYCFIEKGISLLSGQGEFGMIVPNKLLHTKAAAALRNLLRDQQGLCELLNFGDAQLFEGATNYSSILLVSGSKRESFAYRKTSETLQTGEPVQVKFTELSDSEPWNFAEKDLALVFKKMSHGSSLLESLTWRFGTGTQTGADKILTLTREERQTFEAKLLRPIFRGRDVKRYGVSEDSKLAIFPYEEKEGDFGLLSERKLKEFPKAYRHLVSNRKKLDSRIWFGQTASQLSGAWFGYVYLDKREAFERPHILTPSLSDRANFAVGTGDLFLTGTAGVTSIILEPSIKENLKYILGLLNSRLLALYAVQHSPPFSGGFFKFSAPYLKKLPIRRIDFCKPADKARHDKLVGLVEKMLVLTPKLRAAKTDKERATLQNAVTATDGQIDQLVYELYELTPEEIKLVEEDRK